MQIRALSLIASAILIASCGGGGGDGGGGSGGGPGPTNASPGGIWTGTDPTTGYRILGLITEGGRAQFLVDDGYPPTQYWGSISTSGNQVSSNSLQVANELTYFGTATLTGTITERQRIAATLNFTPVAGCAPSVCPPAQTAQVTLDFSTVYNQSGSLSRVVGNWRDQFTGQVYSVNSNGEVFLQDSDTGCIINGRISEIDTRYNAYDIRYDFSSCRIPYESLNGTRATGLLTMDSSQVPNLAVFAAQYRVNAVTYTVFGQAEKT